MTLVGVEGADDARLSSMSRETPIVFVVDDDISVRESLELLIRTEREDGDRVRVSVRDAGVGVDPQIINKLFDSFYTTKSEGMGVGLSVSRSIIERHHGRLWAEPNDGPGATFSFSIPSGPESVTAAATR